MNEIATHTLEVPGAVLTYDVRESDGTDAPLMLIGSPMDASGFGSLAARFPDRTIVTYDPRGVSRSEKADPLEPSTPEQHADDLHRVISAVGGPVDLFASSGGAVNALALVARYPDDVRTLVAHEPPAAREVPDREQALAACRDIGDSYQRDGLGPAMAKFIMLVSMKGPVPENFGEISVSPADFGLPTEDDGSRGDPLLAQNIITCTHVELDYDALRSASARIVVAVGVESDGELAHRAGLGVAEKLGRAPTMFPSNHAGFLGGEFGQQGDPDAFAAKLREVLAA